MTPHTTHHIGSLAVPAVAVGTMHFGTTVDVKVAFLATGSRRAVPPHGNW